MTTIRISSPALAAGDLPERSRSAPHCIVNPDQQMVDQLAARNHEALELAYDRHGKPLFSLCHKRLGNPRDCGFVVFG